MMLLSSTVNCFMFREAVFKALPEWKWAANPLSHALGIAKEWLAAQAMRFRPDGYSKPQHGVFSAA